MFTTSLLENNNGDEIKMSREIVLDDPCLCGSGKKFKYCCHRKNYQVLDGGEKIKLFARTLDSVPAYNPDGRRSDMPKEEMIDSCIEVIYQILRIEKVGMLADLVDKVVQDLNIVPNFTYREIGMQMENDGRFEVYQMQVCSLKGTEPVRLLLDKFDR